MNSKRILLTAFRGSSAEALLKDVTDHRTLLLPNDKVKDSEKLIEVLSKEVFDYIISFGQRPNIKNKVHIETTAREGEFQIHTDFDCSRLQQLFEKNGIEARISHNAGTSFCNKLYLNGLKYLEENESDTKMVFVHIPFMKNIADFEKFQQSIMQAINDITGTENRKEEDIYEQTAITRRFLCR